MMFSFFIAFMLSGRQRCFKIILPRLANPSKIYEPSSKFHQKCSQNLSQEALRSLFRTLEKPLFNRLVLWEPLHGDLIGSGGSQRLNFGALWDNFRRTFRVTFSIVFRHGSGHHIASIVGQFWSHYLWHVGCLSRSL